MIVGAHSIIYSRDADSDRTFLRDVLGLSSVDAGDGWLIFALPPAEVAVHPSHENDVHEFYLMSDDVARLAARLRKQRIACSPVEDRGWGLLTRVTLPGGGTLGIYEPRHVRPGVVARQRKTRRTGSRPSASRRRARGRNSSRSPRTRR